MPAESPLPYSRTAVQARPCRKFMLHMRPVHAAGFPSPCRPSHAVPQQAGLPQVAHQSRPLPKSGPSKRQASPPFSRCSEITHGIKYDLPASAGTPSRCLRARRNRRRRCSHTPAAQKPNYPPHQLPSSSQNHAAPICCTVLPSTHATQPRRRNPNVHRHCHHRSCCPYHLTPPTPAAAHSSSCPPPKPPNRCC